MSRREFFHSQLHLCFERSDGVRYRRMYTELKWVRKKHGVESVRIIVATDAVLYSLSPLRVLFVHDGLHRCGRNNVDNMPVVSPICFTRYPTHPKGWIERPENFARPQGTFEERLRRGFQIRLDV